MSSSLPVNYGNYVVFIKAEFFSEKLIMFNFASKEFNSLDM